MEEKESLRIEVSGVVQGVGFRPFLFNLSEKYNIKGIVRNTKKGVEIVVTGSKRAVSSYLEELKNSPPPLAIINQIEIQKIDSFDFKDFSIAPSFSGDSSNIYLSPDVAVCRDCKEDFFSPSSRFYKYPFVNCTNCGPRFSIIRDHPYDRKNTTMSVFEMCPACEAEYKNIRSRRYHAQPISCEVCGPVYKLLNKDFKEIKVANIFDEVNGLLKKGSIIAVKGVGGYHLILDATNLEAVLTLRERKKRDRKPFALLFRDEELLKEYVEINHHEKQILNSKEKPIVLLKKKKNIIATDPDPIAGSSPYYGVMLPYAPFHYLMLEKIPILICTSANISGEPIVYKDMDIERLKDLADYFLVHNREIVRYVEDSVVKVIEIDLPDRQSIELLFRKSRGYAPKPLFLTKSFSKKIMGLGSDLKATVSILKNDSLIQSQYIGDLADYESYESYLETIEDFKKIFEFEPDLYVCDLHPNFLSTSHAHEIAANKDLIMVQHHKAHIASVCLENNIFDEPVVGIALDGTGYGEDGMIWGGEIFYGSLKEGFNRAGKLSYKPFPFGDSAIKDPEKMFLSYLLSSKFEDERLLNQLSEPSRANIGAFSKAVSQSKVLTSSLGRLFDCVSYLLGFRKKVSYEGEPAQELENLIYKKFELKDWYGAYDISFNETNPYEIDVNQILIDIFSDFLSDADRSVISIKFHSTVVHAFMLVVEKLSKEKGCKKIIFSGGSFQNSYLTYHFFKKSHELGLTPLINRFSPPNDACISIGQCALGF